MTFGLENSFRRELDGRAQTGRLVRTVALLELLVIVALGGYIYLSPGRLPSGGSPSPSSDYQAVFLRSGQVYFGKIVISEDWLTLTDIYYLQAAQNLQAGLEPFSQANFQLVKLGTELHAPEDAMYINPDDVSFWENLSEGSRIIEAIKKYKESR